MKKITATLLNSKPSRCLAMSASSLLFACAGSPSKPLEQPAQITLADFTTDGCSPYWPTPFRWSYGWPYTRGYRTLNLTELAVAQEKWQRYSQSKMTKTSSQGSAETTSDICDLPAATLKE